MKLLNDMYLFVEVAKAMSFSRAAESMKMPSSTLSRRISSLENEIGLRLLHRTTRKLELTEAGQIYYQRCRRIVEEAQLAHEQLGGMLAQPSGLLRVLLPFDFSSIFLDSLLAEFASLYPGISFEFDITERKVDLFSASIDVAIQVGELFDSGLIARKLVQLPSYLYASPRYLANMEEPTHPSQLVQYDCLCLPHVKTWKLKHSNEKVEVKVNGRFIVNTANMLCRFGVLDLGVLMLPKLIVADDEENGRLKRILHDWEGEPVSIYALTETRLLPAKTQLFIEFLQKKFN
ncbi:LysR family transcriptional regulator [Serratia fonticola]|uniref:LysR family transcriptional regulator n=1 Tax=Serratia fonticola TaxID=47917 RepID=A0AAJ2D8D8_SERFO|nr:LysR family transcriptional regulator [Serratia fonticola]MDQ9126128.1 LysR family transcriptional regulator [Serratia fonticola]